MQEKLLMRLELKPRKAIRDVEICPVIEQTDLPKQKWANALLTIKGNATHNNLDCAPRNTHTDETKLPERRLRNGFRKSHRQGETQWGGKLAQKDTSEERPTAVESEADSDAKNGIPTSTDGEKRKRRHWKKRKVTPRQRRLRREERRTR